MRSSLADSLGTNSFRTQKQAKQLLSSSWMFLVHQDFHERYRIHKSGMHVMITRKKIDPNCYHSFMYSFEVIPNGLQQFEEGDEEI